MSIIVGFTKMTNFAKLAKEDNKTGILTNDDFTKITNLPRIYMFGKN